MTPRDRPRRRTRSAEEVRRRNALQSAKYGVTATYRYGGTFRTLVGRSKANADRLAFDRWGEWEGEPCYSTPLSIYNDLTGETARRMTRAGMRSPWAW